MSSLRGFRAIAANPPLWIGALGVLLLLGAALFGPMLSAYDPQAWRLVEFGPDHTIAVPPIAPNAQHLLGTDPMGRDLLSRLLWGARITLTCVGLVVALRSVLGIGFGLLAAAMRDSAVEAIILGTTRAVSGVPQLLLALLLVIWLRDWNLLGFVVALSAIGWADLTQFTHAEATRLRRSEHVQAAVAVGASPGRVYRSHIFRNLLPALAALVALEAGSVLVVLAELGFIGLFISGGTFFVDDFGKPILPVRDRAPEWGQMLAGARGYAFANQWVALVPALVVASVVAVFNLLGEGVRAAVDPHNQRAVSPAVQTWLGRVAIASVIIASLGFAQLASTSTGISVDDARSKASDLARRSDPSATLIAQVIRFSSERHALARPEQLNFYFATPEGTLRVGFVDASESGLESRWFEDQDNLPLPDLVPVSAPELKWEDALAAAERAAGTRFRNASTSWVVRVILIEMAEGPRYVVSYGTPPSPYSAVAVPIAPSGELDRSVAPYLNDARQQALNILGPKAGLLAIGSFGGVGSLAASARTTAWTFAFGDGGKRFLMMAYDLERTVLVPSSFEGPAPILRGPFAIPPALQTLASTDIDDAMERVVEHALRAAPAGTSSFSSAMYTPAGLPPRLLAVFQWPTVRREFVLNLETGEVTEVPN